MAGFLPPARSKTSARLESGRGKFRKLERVVTPMVKERRRKNKVDLKEFVKRGEWQAGAEVDALEVLMRESYNNPEVFHEEWLRPLLREGLTLESAYDVLVEGTIRPN